MEREVVRCEKELELASSWQVEAEGWQGKVIALHRLLEEANGRAEHEKERLTIRAGHAVQGREIELGAAMQHAGEVHAHALHAVNAALQETRSQLAASERERLSASDLMDETHRALTAATEQEGIIRMALEDANRQANEAEACASSMQENRDACKKEASRAREEALRVHHELLELQNHLLTSPNKASPSPRIVSSPSPPARGLESRLGLVSGVWELAKKVDRCRKKAEHLAVVKLQGLPKESRRRLEPELPELDALSKEAKEDLRSPFTSVLPPFTFI